MLELQSVGRVVGRDRHISDVSLTLERGSLNVLLGPTLSGKTSLMRLMAGLDAPTEGRIRMDGVDVTGVPVRRRNVAMVYQQFINYPSLTVYENIASPLRIAGRPKAEIDAAVRRTADLMRLGPFLDRTPLNLSGGQQQRTALARALVKGADLVLLDEPLANLDYKLREELREELPKLFAATGAIFVYATTEPHEALLLGGRTATLSKGRITQVGPTAEVYRQPVDLLTARTFSDPPLNVLPARKDGDRFSVGDTLSFPVAPAHRGLAGGDYTIALRPHHLGVVEDDTAPGEAVLAARIQLSEVTGSQSFIHADYAGERIIALVHGVRRVTPGDVIRLAFDPAKILVFGTDGAAVSAPLPLAA